MVHMNTVMQKLKKKKPGDQTGLGLNSPGFIYQLYLSQFRNMFLFIFLNQHTNDFHH